MSAEECLCQNGGVCVDSNGTCDCPSGYMGLYCQFGRYKSHNPIRCCSEKLSISGWVFSELGLVHHRVITETPYWETTRSQNKKNLCVKILIFMFESNFLGICTEMQIFWGYLCIKSGRWCRKRRDEWTRWELLIMDGWMSHAPPPRGLCGETWVWAYLKSDTSLWMSKNFNNVAGDFPPWVKEEGDRSGSL